MLARRSGILSFKWYLVRSMYCSSLGTLEKTCVNVIVVIFGKNFIFLWTKLVVVDSSGIFSLCSVVPL